MKALSGLIRSPVALILALLLLASALRFHRLDAQSLWYDEGVAYAHSLRTLPELIPHLQRNVHVPAYFTLLGWWQDLTGSSEFALRALSALFSVASIAWTYALGRRLFHPLAGVVAAALTALNSFSIYYAQEARMYAMLAAVAGASMWLFAGWLRGRPPLRGRWLSVVALGFANALGLYTHVAYALVIAAQGALTAFWFGGQLLHASLGERAAHRSLPFVTDVVRALLLAALLFLPWLPTALPQLSAQPNLSQAIAASEFLPQLLGVLALGLTYESSAGIAIAAIALLLGLGLLPLAGRRDARLLLPLVWLLVSVGIYLHLELTTRYLRFLLPAQLAFALWLGQGAYVVWTREIRGRQPTLRALPKLAAAAALGALLLAQVAGLDALYHGADFQRDDVRGLVARIESELRDGDAIVVSAPGFSEILGYYYTGEAPVYALPTSADAGETASDVLSLTLMHRRILAIFYGSEEQDPERAVERNLNFHLYQASEEWVGDIRFARYVGIDRMEDMQSLNALFGESIRLSDYSTSGRSVKPGDYLLVGLFWLADETPDRRYKVFLQLLDREGKLVAQRDSEPAKWTEPTTSWEAGFTYPDRQALLIPEHLPAGDYTLIVGLYDISDPAARLPIGDSTYLELGTIEVVESI